MSSSQKSEYTGEVRVVSFFNGKVTLVDQRLLPLQFSVIECATVESIFTAIRDMTVRGAPAIGAAGAFGVAIAGLVSAKESEATTSTVLKALESSKIYLDGARPTAVNLAWATGRILDIARAYAALPSTTASSLSKFVETESQALADEDVAINRALAQAGAAIVPDGAQILTHCNTGALATVDIGTALGVIYESH